MFNIADVSRMSSTLVETVSINYEDFNDSFLTCGTCLSSYDGEDHTPKLLPCSHTVCKSCLEYIVEASRERNQIRCPICRGGVTLPSGGVSSFPPSFIVNQLLDLMARQRRDIIPKCSMHPNQELMFCESCDTVFCMDCMGGSHNGRGASAHTVIPFSIAIKRMSEILLYKASLCMKNLNSASGVVSEEIEKIDTSAERCIESITQLFREILSHLDERQHDLIHAVQRVRDDKKKVLQEQLDIIENEKVKVQQECQGLQSQVEVRNITKKIGELNEKLDMSTTLLEPRENAFMKFEYQHNSALGDLRQALDVLGSVRISKTFPALCTATLELPVIHLKMKVTVHTVDYHGNPRTSGGDPVEAVLLDEDSGVLPLQLEDHNTGNYTVSFTPTKSGSHKLEITIFGRSIKESPFVFEVSDHNNPVKRVGSQGCGDLQFLQPVAVVFGRNNQLFVLDTGNSRIKILDSDLSFVRHIGSHGLEYHSGTGLATTPQGNLMVVNWRTKYVTELNLQGEVVKKFTSERFEEPISIAVNSHGEIIVADNGLGKLLVYDPQGMLINEIGSKGDKQGQFKLITSIYVASNDNILVTDTRLQVFSRGGNYLREIAPPTQKGTYGGVTMDSHGNILATRQEKGKSSVLYYKGNGELCFVIDSDADKLKRPSGLATTEDGHVLVVDLGNNAIKRFRYM